jgi:hypothetical protein
MTKVAYGEFCTLVAELADERSTSEIVSELRRSHAEKLESLATFLLDNAVTNIVRNLRRRTASVRVAGGLDLFGGHSVPAMTTKEEIDEKGKKVRLNVHTEHLTKKELRDKIASLSQLPPKKNKKLRDYETLYADIDGHCSDDETVEVGLKRSKHLI